MNKTHYRKVFKSDHLSTADLEDFLESGKPLIFTIKQVRQEQNAKVAGRKINANIAYFQENIKPLVLNATNSKTMKNLTCSSFVEDWCNVTVELFIDPTASLKGEIVGGVRISPRPVRLQKPVITPDNNQMWNRAVNSFRQTGSLEAVLSNADVSPEHQQMIVNEAQNV